MSMRIGFPLFSLIILGVASTFAYSDVQAEETPLCTYTACESVDGIDGCFWSDLRTNCRGVPGACFWAMCD